MKKSQSVCKMRGRRINIKNYKRKQLIELAPSPNFLIVLCARFDEITMTLQDIEET